MVINDLMVIGQEIFNYTKNERVFTQKTYFCMILKNKVMKGVKGSETKRLIREAAYKQFIIMLLSLEDELGQFVNRRK